MRVASAAGSVEFETISKIRNSRSSKSTQQAKTTKPPILIAALFIRYRFKLPISSLMIYLYAYIAMPKLMACSVRVNPYVFRLNKESA